MKKYINKLRITNFKSIKDIELDCRRINLFIGKPNVGKSNILEALSLYGMDLKHRFLSDYIRYKTLKDLFFYQDTSHAVELQCDLGHIILEQTMTLHFNFLRGKQHAVREAVERSEDDFWIITIHDLKEKYGDSLDYLSLGMHGHVHSVNMMEHEAVKKYTFQTKKEKYFRMAERPDLATPYGENLFNVVRNDKTLYKKILIFLKAYGLELLEDVDDKKFFIRKENGRLAYKIPYDFMAESLRRIIFYYIAIETSKNPILLFEEPESHSFPAYIQQLANKMIKSTDNQFFITTHSPHLFNTITKQMNPEDISVFVTSLNNNQTKVCRLKNDELAALIDSKTDVFFNIPRKYGA